MTVAWSDVAVAIPTVLPVRSHLLAALLTQVAEQCPGAAVVVQPHVVEEPPCVDFPRAMAAGAKLGRPWVLQLEDDVCLAPMFGAEALAHGLDEADCVTLFSRSAKDAEAVARGERTRQVPASSFSMSQGFLLRADLAAGVEDFARSWYEGHPEHVRGADLLLGAYLKSVGASLLVRVPSLVQHRMTPSTLPNHRGPRQSESYRAAFGEPPGIEPHRSDSLESLESLESLADSAVGALTKLPLDERVRALNDFRRRIQAASPFAGEPVDCVEWYPAGDVRANDYNPNSVAPPEMRALAHSVRRFGFTTPIVGAPREGGVEVVDGYHRNRVGREHVDIRARLQGYLPVVLLRGEITRAERVSATVLHNKARGEHAVQKEIPLVEELAAAGWSDDEVGRGLCKSDEEIIRLRQAGGVASVLANRDYDKAWDW